MRKGPLFALLGRRAKANGQFDSPRGVAIDKEGNHIVASNHCIQVFDSAGNFVRKFGTEGKGKGKFNNPTGVWWEIFTNMMGHTSRPLERA